MPSDFKAISLLIGCIWPVINAALSSNKCYPTKTFLGTDLSTEYRLTHSNNNNRTNNSHNSLNFEGGEVL